MIRVLVNGANGKMGKMAVSTIENNAEFKLAGTIGRHDDLAREIKKCKPDVVLDLTNAESVLSNTQTIIDSSVHPVIGTTGLVKKQVNDLQKQCEKLKLGGIIAPNFSLGAMLMIKHAQEIAAYFPDVEIIEMHHNGKLDSPSGTSIYTAEMISASRETTPSIPENIRETVRGARGADYQHIPIHSVRLPGCVAHQQIIFGSVGETLTIRHDSIDRQCFMPGILLACKKVMHLNELIYGLENII
jgi:4-hydroxy-tetrahydrodipicolinate reductase